LVFFAGCASLRSTSSNRLDQHIAEADAAYRQLDGGHLSMYNDAVASIAKDIDGDTPNELRTQLDSLHVKLDPSKIDLPLARYHVVSRSRRTGESIGAPMLLDYDTSSARFYPPDGLLCSATALYRRENGEPHLSFVTAKATIELNGSRFALRRDDDAALDAMSRRGRSVVHSGFRNMLRPGSMQERSGIFLTEPYDPNKAVVLMVPGLQSTPFAFVDLRSTNANGVDCSPGTINTTALFGSYGSVRKIPERSCIEPGRSMFRKPLCTTERPRRDIASSAASSSRLKANLDPFNSIVAFAVTNERCGSPFSRR